MAILEVGIGMSDDRKHRTFSPQARQAAAIARQQWAAEKPAFDALAVFVVRLGHNLRFGWEIRKFGSMILSRSDEGFASLSEARIAGEKALVSMISS